MKWIEMQKNPLILTSLDQSGNKSLITEVSDAFVLTVHNEKEIEILKEYFSDLEGAKIANLKKELFIVRKIKKEWDATEAERSLLVLKSFKDSSAYKSFDKKPFKFGKDSIQFFNLETKESFEISWHQEDCRLTLKWIYRKETNKKEDSSVFIFNQTDLDPIKWLTSEIKNLSIVSE